MTTMPPIVVLAGGLGTRLWPTTATIPKSLVDVAGRPFIAHQLELFARRGIREAVFCVGYLGEQIEDFIKTSGSFGVDVRFSYDGDHLRGTGGAIARTLPMLGEEFLVTYGDSYLDIDYGKVVEAFFTSDKPALMTVLRNEDNWDRSNVEFSAGEIKVYDKKNRTQEMRHIDFGLLVMTPRVFSDWKDRGTFDLAELLGPLATQKRLAGFEVTTRFYEAGSVSGIADLAAHLKTISGGCNLPAGLPPRRNA